MIFQKGPSRWFEAKIIEAGAGGAEQQAQWLEIRQFIVTGWGVMNPATPKNAARAGFPTTTSSGNPDRLGGGAVGAAAKGYISAAINPSGKDFK